MLLLAYNSKIVIKKMAISGPAEINLISSSLKIRSFYAQTENREKVLSNPMSYAIADLEKHFHSAQ
jgi:hypothetical protein